VKIDHVAIVVQDLDAALHLYCDVLGFDRAYREVITDQGVEVVGLRAADSIIELLRPLDEDSSVARYRGDAPGKLHHTAYRVTDIEAKIAELKSKGVRMIDERPRSGANGNLIAFIHPQSTGGVLIELCQPKG
jgi:methylmalonyl-CoA/ethylmalonyl-CoA epimerase